MRPADQAERAGADRPLVYDNVASGHRANYVRLLAGLIDGDGEIAPYLPNIGRLLTHPAIVLSSFEGSPRRNLALLIARVLLRRKTAVLLLRAHLTSHRRGLGRLVHAAALRLMGTSRFVLPLSIVASEELARVCPQVRVIADPEFWDYEFSPPITPDERLMAEVRARAAGRRVVLIAGKIGKDKALGELGRVFAADPAVGRAFYPVLAGSLLPEAAGEGAFIAKHGWHIDGWIDDVAFRSLFHVADFAWCAYRPQRDMSSGILGRCIQSEVIPMVRRGAVAEGLARRWTDPVVIDFSDPAASAHVLLAFSGKPTPPRHDALRAQGEYVRRLLREFLYPIRSH